VSTDPKTVSLIMNAHKIALAAHAGQRYGKEPYIVHLKAVDDVVCEFGQTDHSELRAAAWLHDVLEETYLAPDGLIARGIPVYVVALVDAVTDRPGEHRGERHGLTYPRIRRMPEAVLLKLADRIANVRACVASDDRRLEMYRSEQDQFQSALRRQGEHHQAWELLNAAFFGRRRRDTAGLRAGGAGRGGL
jgi:guanosine-3',5'-bis(diphosphate) 3'-pyrophosphohydrolase